MSIEEAGPTDRPRTPDHRSRRLAERRGRVFDAAISLFVEKGYENTTMEDIAARADVARASVFNYYQRKAAFLDEWSERRRDRAAVAVGEIDPEHRDVRQLLARYMAELASVSEGSRVETVAVLGASIRSTNMLGDPALAQALTPFVEQAQGRGELRPGIRTAAAARLLATGYLATLSAWIDSDPAPFDLETELAEMLELLFHGILIATR